LAKSAKQLFIHRNTLVYRINKINEILGMNPDDEGNKAHMFLSFMILEYLQKFSPDSRKSSSSKKYTDTRSMLQHWRTL
jgi:hypothetical protein